MKNLQHKQFTAITGTRSISSSNLKVNLDGGRNEGSTTTDRKQTDREQRRLAEKGDPKCIFTIPRAILPKPSLGDEITATKSVTKSL